MRRTTFLVVLVVLLVGAGWSVGRTQGTVAEFEITVDAPVGEVKVICNRGCEPSSTWMKSVNDKALIATFACSGSAVTRCRGTVDGHGIVLRRHKP
jgi:hypothetical protein